MKVVLGRVLFVFLFAVAIGALVKDKSLFVVEEVSIRVTMNEAERKVWADLNSQIHQMTQAYKGLSLWRVSLVEVQKKLSLYPFIKQVQVQKSWPHSLEISYSLPSLKAIHQVGAGQFKLLTEDGQWLGPTKWSKLPRLPWIKGEWINKRPAMKEGVLGLLRQLPDKGPMSSTQISEIQFNELDGFLLTLVKSAQQIRFGSENFQTKAQRVSQVLEYLQIRGLESRVIDANFSKKVLVRLRNHP